MSVEKSLFPTGNSAQAEGLRLLRTLRGHEETIHRLAWSPDLRTLASPSRDCTVRLWNFESGDERAVLRGHESWVNSVTWSRNGTQLATGTEKGTVHLWDIETLTCIETFRAHRSRVECLAWSGTNGLLASASGDGTVAIWSLPDAKEVTRLVDHYAWANAVAWSPDGRYLATGAEDSTVKIWDADKFSLCHTLKGHADWVTDLAWAPNSSYLASAADTTIRIWDPDSGQLMRSVIGHEDRVKCLTFSFDGRLLASKGDDNTFRIWRTDVWQQVAVVDEPTIRELNPENSIAFHPSIPVLATLGELDRVIRLWSLDTDSIFALSPKEPEVFYQNAKIVLVGASSTGKSCLARSLMHLDFEPQESTHGMKVWRLDRRTAMDSQNRNVQREVFLWDLAGQVDYQLIHQLFLDQTSLALVLFDPSSPVESLADVHNWVDALRQSSDAAPPYVLIAGRVDRGVPAITAAEIQSFVDQHQFAGYFSTSAKTGQGIPELRDFLNEKIPWETLPLTQSPAVWRELGAYLLLRREAKEILARCSDLKISFQLSQKEAASDRAFDTVIAHLQTQGLVWRLSFGDLLLLRPELLNDYASAVILGARRDPRNLGTVLERDVLDSKVDLSAVDRIADRHAEQWLLQAVIHLFLDRQIAFREGDYLVFPSKSNLPQPKAFDTLTQDTIYHFGGSAELIYATLVVRLATGGAFELVESWRGGAVFQDSLGRPCGMSLEQPTDSKHRLGIYFDSAVSMETRILFSRFIHDNLHRRALEKTVERQRLFRCPVCGYEVRNSDAIQRRLAAGKRFIVCQDCDPPTQVSIVDELELRFADPSLLQQVRALEKTGSSVRDSQVGLTTSNAKRKREEYDVFLAYNSADGDFVEAIAENLRRRGLNPWFDRWCIPPGRQFLEEIQRVFHTINSVAAFIGPKGLGQWEVHEIQIAFQLFIRRKVPLIPVILPGRQDAPESPSMLDTFSRVPFEASPDDAQALDLLEWGITGIRPIRHDSR